MDDDVFTSNESCELSKNDLIRLLQSGDDNIALIAPEKFKSPIWERFRIVFYKGEKLDFVQCVGCQLVLMYRSRTGTASLLRHRCSRFPVSVQDQKQEAAGRYADLLMDMASSSHNAIELKQEMMSDEESFELKLETDDDQQYENEQTNKGLMESFSLLEKSFMTVDELMLSREEVELAQRNNDPQLCFERPRNHRHSNTWDRFEIVFYRDVRQNFAKCLSCSSIVSYKKTTGTASLIRHKCKNTKSPQPVKQESLITLLTQSKTPPVLTPAPTFEIPTSTVVSSSGRSENPSMLELAAMNLTFTQIRWLCQSLISTEVISDTSYLNFLQSLVNFGADFGKQNISNIINRNVICQQMIPKKLTSMKTELLKSMKGTEFSISFHKWNSLRNNQYITVVGYFFSADFIYRNHILGTKSCDKDDDVSKIVNKIANEYKTDEDMKLKCIGETAGHDFQTFPCIVGQISKVIISAIEANNESKEFFKKIYKVAHDVLDIPMKNSLDDASDIQKIKILFELYQFGNENVDFECDPIAKRFTKLMGSLFSAISSITATSDNGERCVTSNKVYLWFKKLLKLYASLEDDLAVDILKSIEKLKIPDIYQIAVFLDPNFKSLKFLETSERIKLLDNVRKNLRKMIVEDDSSEPSNKKQKLEKTNSKKTHLNDTFLEFMDMSMESTDDQVNSEIQCYMGLKLENPVEIVEFWRDTDCFPYLKKLARNILNMPSCTFHSNCCFIGAGNELYMKFQNLPADEIETFTFLHQNL